MAEEPGSVAEEVKVPVVDRAHYKMQVVAWGTLGRSKAQESVVRVVCKVFNGHNYSKG
jgi:hypothetical protein